MKALSLRQPWAWLVVHGGKTIENRKWNTKFRGEFLIHAAKGMTGDEYADALEFAMSVNNRNPFPQSADLRRGGIIGRARLVDVIKPCVELGDRCTCGRAWHIGWQFGFVLEDVASLPFSERRGELGFFEVT